MSTRKKYPFVVFVSGFVVMAVELLSVRIVAPIIGSSVYTWTSLIGVILLGVSIGNYLGGYLIDRNPNETVLGRLLLGGSVFVALVPLLTKSMPLAVFLPLSLVIKILIISLVLFLLPAVFLGTIYPSSLKLYLRQLESAGESAGLLSALGALGSILGTFASGFFLVGFLGSAMSLYLLAILLFLSSFLFLKFYDKFALLALLIIVLLILTSRLAQTGNQNMLFEKESNYYKIKVIKNDDLNVKILFLDFDSHSIEHESGQMLGTYQEIAPLFQALNKSFEKALFIGGGSYNLPKDFYDIYKSETLVVEIDPLVTKTAEKFFNLGKYPIKTVHSDGRYFLATTQEKYDLIFDDAFNSFISIPWYLGTREARQLAKSRLEPGGIYAINIISALEGEAARWYESAARTFSQVFPNFSVIHFKKDKNQVQNIILLGINSDEKIDANKMQFEIDKLVLASEGRLVPMFEEKPIIPQDAIILRDDFAPQEKLTLKLINSSFPEYAKFLHSLQSY